MRAMYALIGDSCKLLYDLLLLVSSLEIQFFSRILSCCHFALLCSSTNLALYHGHDQDTETGAGHYNPVECIAKSVGSGCAVSVLNFGGSFLHFSIAKGHLSINRHSVGGSSKLGGVPGIYFGIFPLSVGIDSISP